MVHAPSKPQRIMDTAEVLLANIAHEKTYKKEELATLLQMKPDTMAFQLAMSDVTLILERSGYHLTTAGSNGRLWTVVPLDRSSHVVNRFNRQAFKLLQRSAIFAHSVLTNHGDKLTPEQKRKLEKQEQIQAMRYVLASRLR